MAVGLCLEFVLCSAHRCSCGAIVSDRGILGLACRLAVGRLARHNAINDIIHRALGRAGVPSVLEPRGLTSSDERRPDGPLSRPGCHGVQCTSESHLNRTVHAAGASVEFTVDTKNCKYADLLQVVTFVPVAVETLDPICSDEIEFIAELGRRILSISGDPRDTASLFQRISIAVQRGNAAAVLVPLRLVSNSD